MATSHRSVYLQTLKMVITAGWLVVVTLASQGFITQRTETRQNAQLAERARDLHRRAAAFRDGLSGPADPRLSELPYNAELSDAGVEAIRNQKGILEITADATADPLRVADSLDRSVRKAGIDSIGLASAVYERAGFDLTLELLRRGYTDQEILKLFGGNAARVIATSR